MRPFFVTAISFLIVGVRTGLLCAETTSFDKAKNKEGCPPIFSEEGIPEVASIQQGAPDLPPLHNFPSPQKDSSDFSRKAQIPYIDQPSGTLVIEYIMPPICRDGASTFYIDQIGLSGDGKQMTITTHRIQSPYLSSHPRETGSTLYTSTLPYVFRLSTGIFTFTVDSTGIKACRKYAYKPGGRPVFQETIFPSSRMTYGFFRK